MSEPDYTRRRKKLHLELRSNQPEGYYTDDLLNLRYLTGFKGSAGSMVLLDSSKSILFLDGRYRNYGETFEADDLKVEQIDSDRIESLQEVISSENVESVHFERDRLSYSVFRSIVEKTELEERTYGDDWIGNFRKEKDESEIENHEEAIRRTLDLFDIVETWIEPGISERKMSRFVRRELEERGEGLAFDPLVLMGERTANPHCPSTDHSLGQNDALLLDMGVKVNGYCSDLTRMFFTEEGTRQEELYDLSKRAAARAFDIIEPGVSTETVTEKAHDLVRDEGFKDNIRHGLGHGVGLNVHEPPKVSEKSDETLSEGMIVTLEPGIYIDGVGGGRIEHMCLVTEDGARILDEANEYI
ncbi:MAG: M24 family metallopeptidase [bacterium]